MHGSRVNRRARAQAVQGTVVLPVPLPFQDGSMVDSAWVLTTNHCIIVLVDVSGVMVMIYDTHSARGRRG